MTSSTLKSSLNIMGLCTATVCYMHTSNRTDLDGVNRSSQFQFRLKHRTYCDNNVQLTQSSHSTPSLKLAASEKMIIESKKHSIPNSSVLLASPTGMEFRRIWIIDYDTRSRNPRWTYECLRRDAVVSDNSNSSRKHANFFAEPTIVETFKVRPQDYNNCGLDRGHMIPSADFSIGSQDLMNSTYTMANISPQNVGLNRNYWAKFEAWIRSLLSDSFEEIEVITGPCFAPVFTNNQWVYMQQTIGVFPKLISVPTHFYKVIKARRYLKSANQDNSSNHELEQVVIGAFLLPNEDVPVETPIDRYAVKIDQLEAIGIRFFDSSLTDMDRSKLDKLIPESRDLANVLNISKQKHVVDGTGGDIRKIDHFARILHLCQVVPCHKPFFTKK